LKPLEQILAGTIDYIMGYVQQPWFAYQLAIIIVIFFASWFAGKVIEPLLEERAREIKGNPGLLRVVVATLRRVRWIFFVAALYIALTVLRAYTWPSRSYLISIVFSLATAWLVISVLSRIIRNRAVARTVAWVGWIYVAANILRLTGSVENFLDGISIDAGSYRLSLLLALKAVVILTVTLWLATMAGNFLDRRLQSVDELTPSIRVLLGKVVKIVLVILAGVFALSSIGIDLTALTIFSGAVGVGLGFGLQKVVSNFISGVIILLDESIKPGDTITLGETFGWIRELRARFVSVVTRDGREFLIPNEDFITREVINWSFSDEYVRLDVPFGVSYESDPHQVADLAIKAAMSVGRVDDKRKPVCWMTEFGDSSLNFLLRFWIRDPQQGLTNIRGKVLLAVWDTFKANGVQIPYPHREIVMKTPVSVKGELPQGRRQAKQGGPRQKPRA
jgi:small-conductance mechanosensitive channel